MNGNEMEALDALFDQAKDVVADETDFPKLNDGVHVGRVKEIKMKQSSNGKWQIGITLAEKETGAFSWLNLFLTAKDNTPENNAKAMARARGMLEKLGADKGVSSLKALIESAQDKAVGALVQYELETRNGYQNVNQFKVKLLEAPDTAEANDTTDPFGSGQEIDIDDDDLPF